MTCFWDGIVKSLSDDIYKQVCDKRPNNEELVLLLKKNNTKTDNIKWNDKELTEKQLKENMERIEEIDIKNISSGYDCSCFEPVLFLICHCFNVNIDHDFNGFTMKYTHKTDSQHKKILKFKSNSGHFWS